jgi:hypothetical protein
VHVECLPGVVVHGEFLMMLMMIMVVMVVVVGSGDDGGVDIVDSGEVDAWWLWHTSCGRG